MWFQLEVLALLFVLLSFIAWCGRSGQPAYQELQESAWWALDASVRDLATPYVFPDRAREVDEMGGGKGPRRETRQSSAHHGDVPLRMASVGAPVGKRHQVMPYQAKRVAAAQQWRCGCGCVDPEDPQRRGLLLDETFEIDHRIPTRDGGAHDSSNWVAVLRSHHQIKSALESQAAAPRKK